MCSTCTPTSTSKRPSSALSPKRDDAEPFRRSAFHFGRGGLSARHQTVAPSIGWETQSLSVGDLLSRGNSAGVGFCRVWCCPERGRGHTRRSGHEPASHLHSHTARECSRISGLGGQFGWL